MTPYDAYRLGLLPWLVGVPFEGLELAHAAAAVASEAGPPDEALEERLREEVDGLRARNQETVRRVLAVEDVLRDAKLPVPARPSVVEEYRAWFGAVKDAVMEALSPPTREGAALVVGFFLGEIYLTLALGAMARSLHEVAPTNAFLTEHVESLADSLRKLVHRFGPAFDHSELPGPAVVTGRRLLTDLQTPLTSLRALRAQVERLDSVKNTLAEDLVSG